jgi:hypothetical protein
MNVPINTSTDTHTAVNDRIDKQPPGVYYIISAISINAPFYPTQALFYPAIPKIIFSCIHISLHPPQSSDIIELSSSRDT